MSKAKTLLLDIPLKAASQWWADNCMTLAAALAYYTMFSLAPLILISIAVAGAIVGEQAARGQLASELQLLIGRQGAELIQEVLKNAAVDKSGSHWATFIGVVMLILG